ncbi:MAG: FKBP-type peptidyl-prolyl cis-trans isomerase, partial [Candidatus Scalindua rubra]
KGEAMSQAKTGDNVKVHYTGSLKDGKIFDSSKEKEPLEFTIGEKKLISGFENAVIGMTVGETKND